jgi:tetratricopeptide (TPR) repeat protein
MRAGAKALLALPLLVALGYAPALRNDLVWDDRIHVLENPAVRESRWIEIATRPVGSYYRPVVFASFALEALAADAAAPVLHATNLALHSLAACLLFAAASALGATPGAALAASSLFALHPVNSEAVLYASGRTDVLAAAFALAALLLHARAAGWCGLRRLRGARIGAALGFALALGCKESALTLPLAFAVGDRLLAADRRRGLAELRRLWPHALVLAAYAGWRASLPGAGLALDAPADAVPALAAASAALADYARLLLVPAGLHLERFAASEPPWRPVAGLLVLGLGLLAAWRARPPIRFWLAWAALAYLPTSNLVPVYPGLPPGLVFAPEHFLYLPSTGLLAALALAAAPRLARRTLALGLIPVLLAYAAILRDRARDWRDEERLYTHTLEYSPASARVRLNLGNLLLSRGETERAAAEFAAGLAHHPDDPDLLTNAGLAWLALGRLPEAERALARAASVDPMDAQAWANLGALYGATGRLDEARRSYERALERDPRNADARRGLRILDGLAPPPGSRLDQPSPRDPDAGSAVERSSPARRSRVFPTENALLA